MEEKYNTLDYYNKNAKEIKQFIEKWSSNILFNSSEKISITENNTFKKIPVTATTTSENSYGVEMTHNEVEEILGFKLLNYDNASIDKMYYRTYQNDDNSIGRVDIWWAEFKYESEDTFISLSISMLNENADKGYVEAFNEGLDARVKRI